MSLSKANTNVLPYVNVSISEKEIDTSRGYLTNVTHGTKVKYKSIIFHTRENDKDFEYIKNRVNSKSINCRCIYYKRKGVLWKNGSKTIFSLIDSEDVLYIWQM